MDPRIRLEICRWNTPRVLLFTSESHTSFFYLCCSRFELTQLAGPGVFYADKLPNSYHESSMST